MVIAAIAIARFFYQFWFGLSHSKRGSLERNMCVTRAARAQFWTNIIIIIIFSQLAVQ